MHQREAGPVNRACLSLVAGQGILRAPQLKGLFVAARELFSLQEENRFPWIFPLFSNEITRGPVVVKQ